MDLPEPLPGPAYRIHTTRLVIRCWQPADATLLHTALLKNTDHLYPWMAWIKVEPLELQRRIDLLRVWRGNFDHNLNFEYGIFSPDEKLLLGAAGLHTYLGEGVRGIGYWIDKDHNRQGFATETSAAFTRVAFEVDHVTRVEIHCDPKNLASAAVPRKLGFTHEATLHNRIEDADGKLNDSMIWTLFREDYPRSPAAKAQIEAFDVVGRKLI
jgi:RimJ/RimL family protein N-acetyltransferase